MSNLPPIYTFFFWPNLPLLLMKAANSRTEKQFLSLACGSLTVRDFQDINLTNRKS